MYTKQGVAGRRRRLHAPEFKAKVLAECRQPGASIAAVALGNGLNANLVRRWLRLDGSEPAAIEGAAAERAFIELSVAPEAGAARCAKDAIRVELRRGSTTVSVSWPVDAAVECGAWLREWLR